MNHILAYLAYITIAPMALAYILLLNDRWRLSAGGKALLLLWSAAVSVPLPALLMDRPRLSVLFLLLPLLASFPPLWWASRVRDARFLFSCLSGALFSCLANSMADKLVFHWYVPSVCVRLLLDAGFFFLCWKFYRPAFLKICGVARRGWGLLCALPLVLWSAYLVQLLDPEYLSARFLPQAQVFIFCLLLITVLLYAVTFSFFQRLSASHENAVGDALLEGQLHALSRQLARQDDAAERAKILRHDLRHYLPLLSERLRAGDFARARAILDAMRALASGDGCEGRRGPW